MKLVNRMLVGSACALAISGGVLANTCSAAPSKAMVFTGEKGTSTKTVTLSKKGRLQWKRSGGKSMVLTAKSQKNGVLIKSTGTPPKNGVLSGGNIEMRRLKGAPVSMVGNMDTIELPAGKYQIQVKSDAKWSVIVKPS